MSWFKMLKCEEKMRGLLVMMVVVGGGVVLLLVSAVPW
jgi:hypothetical protein